jgi:WD40 repeat protein
MLAAVLALLIARPALQEPPESQPRRLSLVTQASIGRLEDIAVSSDETRILTHDRNFSPRLWDRKTMLLLRVLEGHTTEAFISEFSRDGMRIITASAVDVFVWDGYGHKLGSLILPEKDELVSEAVFSSDGARIIVGSDQGRIYVCNADLEVLEVVKPFETKVTDLQPALNAPIACAGDEAGRVYVFDASDGGALASFDTGQRVLWSRIDRNGTHVVATTIDEKAHLFDVRGKRLMRTYDHFMGSKGVLPLTLMAALFVGKDGDQLLVAEESGLMRLYDVQTGIEKGRLQGHTLQVREIRQSIDGTKVATYGDDEELKIWDTVAQKELPFKRGPGNPTAGEFSPDGGAFWLGHSDGTLRRHDTKTGEYDSEAVGQTVPTDGALVKGRYIFYDGEERWIVDALNPTEVRSLGWPLEQFRFAPNTEKASWKTIGEDEFYIFDVKRGKALMRYLNCLGAEFSRDSNHLVTWHTDGTVYAWQTSDGEKAAGWTMKDNKPLQDLAVSPTEDLIVTLTTEDGTIEVWDYLDGSVELSGDTGFAKPKQCAFSPDGKKIAALGEDGVGIWTQPDGDYVGGLTEDFGEQDEFFIGFSPDNRWLACAYGDRLIVLDATNGEVAYDEGYYPKTPGVRWSRDGRIITYFGNEVDVIDPAKAKDDLPHRFRTAETIMAAQFSDDGSLVITTDVSDGIVVWKLADDPLDRAKRLGSFVQVHRDEVANTWLAIDSDGRYDATDPANVSAAHYVFDWAGGLETIAVEQLKDRFFEPGLLAKLFGADVEKPRAVPDLATLRLYPDLTARLTRSGKIAVSVEERDQGGAGVLKVWVNGKLVETRNNPPGFFEIDPSTYERYFLPTNLLPEGRGNLVRLTVSNKTRDLESPPVTVDVGVPEDLRPPDVRLYALFVGVCDYVGSTKDLTAPANDARELESAVKAVAEHLLPGRVESTVLTAEVGKDDPTRDDILAWFDSVATKATASDIVIVFLSGHGVSEIAGEQDYFFLTPEADPTSIGPLTASSAAISGKELGARLAKIAAAKQVVILDTCHSGAAASQILRERSVAGDYRRAYQAIRDTTGTWMLAGSAADQKSFESSNVGHGMLTYSLLEAIDKASSDGLRQGEGGDLFVDVERWLEYAAARVESLKNEIGVPGVQRPQLARSAGATFDIGVMKPDERGFIGLKPPRPIVIVGEFDQDKEDPLAIEATVRNSLKDDESVTVWADVSAHPRAFRVTGSYSQENGSIKATVYLQLFGEGLARKTIEKFELEGKTSDELVALIVKRTVDLMLTTKLPDPNEIKTGGG